MTSPPPDPLDAIRERLERTQAAVDRLAEETARARAESNDAADAQSPPPPTGDAAAEAQALAALLMSARGLIPEDLFGQLTDIIRQLLVLLRSLLDWWIARLAPATAPPGPAVEDIPII